jgi:hypothetical protein
MLRRTVLSTLAIVALSALAPGCTSKAQKQADIAKGDVAKVQKLVTEKHVDSVPRGLADAASKLGPPLDTVGERFAAIRDKSDDLRGARRSFYAVVEPQGTIAWVDESNWNVTGRVVNQGFPSIKDCLDGKGATHGFGRFGGDPEDALIFVDAVPIKDGDIVIGALVGAWEAIDVAADLQSYLLTEMGLASAAPNVHNKVKEQRKQAMEQPDVWVALFRNKAVYMVDDAYQPLVEAAKGLDLTGKTSGGQWTGTFDVTNTGWGASALRLPGLAPDVGVVVFRHQN